MVWQGPVSCFWFSLWPLSAVFFLFCRHKCVGLLTGTPDTYNPSTLTLAVFKTGFCQSLSNSPSGNVLWYWAHTQSITLWPIFLTLIFFVIQPDLSPGLYSFLDSIDHLSHQFLDFTTFFQKLINCFLFTKQLPLSFSYDNNNSNNNIKCQHCTKKIKINKSKQLKCWDVELVMKSLWNFKSGPFWHSKWVMMIRFELTDSWITHGNKYPKHCRW